MIPTVIPAYIREAQVHPRRQNHEVNRRSAIALIMHPSVALANEVGMGFGHLEIVRVLQGLFALDGNDALAFAFELIHDLARDKLAGHHPAQIAHMERMPSRGADDLAPAIGGGELNVEDLPVVTPEQPHNRLSETSRRFWRPGLDEIANMDILDALQAFACFDQGSRDEATSKGGTLPVSSGGELVPSSSAAVARLGTGGEPSTSCSPTAPTASPLRRA